LPSITDQQEVCLHVSSVDLCSMGWRITDPGICSSTKSTWIDKVSSSCLHAHQPYF